MPTELSPEEGYVFSRIGQKISVKELIPLCPWEESKTLAYLDSLLEKNAIELITVVRKKSPAHREVVEIEKIPHARTEKLTDVPQEIMDLVESERKDPNLSTLDPQWRIEILVRYDLPRDMNPFEVLETTPESEFKEIKNSSREITEDAVRSSTVLPFG